jgi:uncharacterized protein YukE
MAVIDLLPEEMVAFLRELDEANALIRGAAEKTDRAVKKVEPFWKGDSQKAFLRFYGDWRKGIDLHAVALKKSTDQLRRMTEEQEP